MALQNAAGFVQSEVEEKDKIVYREHAGCNCVNAGTQEYDFTLVEMMPHIFRFFHVRKGRDNTFERYRDVIPPSIPDDPTTAMIAFHDAGGEATTLEEPQNIGANSAPAPALATTADVQESN